METQDTTIQDGDSNIRERLHRSAKILPTTEPPPPGRKPRHKRTATHDVDQTPSKRACARNHSDDSLKGTPLEGIDIAGSARLLAETLETTRTALAAALDEQAQINRELDFAKTFSDNALDALAAYTITRLNWLKAKFETEPEGNVKNTIQLEISLQVNAMAPMRKDAGLKLEAQARERLCEVEQRVEMLDKTKEELESKMNVLVSILLPFPVKDEK